MRVSSSGQTDATTPNTVAPTMLGVVVCVLAVVCKRMQQLPTIWDLQCMVGRIQPISLCKPCVMRARGPNNVGRAVQTDPTLLRYASAITKQKKCWELLAEKFDRFQTLCNNTQQHPTTCNRLCKYTTCNIQQCCVRLHGALKHLISVACNFFRMSAINVHYPEGFW